MSRKYLNILVALFSIAIYCLPSIADANTANTFAVGSANYNSNQYAQLTWSLAEAGKVSIFVSCQTGVKVTSPDISTATCNNAFQSTNSATNDAMNLRVVNVSGNPQTITATLSPIDANGNVQSDASRSVSFSVAPLAEPITAFTSSATTSINSYQPITFTWTSVAEVTGANLRLDCPSENISATSSIYTLGMVPCGQTISVTDLPASGSATFSFYTGSVNKIPMTIHVFPAISTGVYDAMHGTQLEFTLQNRKSAAPSVSSSALNTNTVSDMAPVQLSWNTNDSQAVNIRIVCSPDGVQPYVYATTTNTFVQAKCNALAYDSPLSTTGSTTLEFKNKGANIEQVRVAVLPGSGDGYYDATVAKDLVLNVYPAGVTTTKVGTTVNASSTKPTTVNLTLTGKSVKISKALARTLRKGSSGTDVTALQVFLKQFPAIYPEGSTTGYFGPATERAIKKFQEKYGIAKNGDAGYGTTGPRTRAKINEL